MTESTRLVDLVQTTIDDFLSEHTGPVSAVSPDLSPYIDYTRELLAGGKRFRALFCYWGWEAVSQSSDSLAADLNAVVNAASALELFHAAALVHDDIIDNSDTRRGRPSAHRRFESLHNTSGWTGDAASFGRSGALLLGDLLLGWSDELLDDGLAHLGDRAAATAARREFNRMRTDVTCGQYLDILEEHSWRSRDESELLERAHNVIVHKSAKYSIEAPLAIGATMGGGSLDQVSSLRDFGLPLGVAYQLRDDLLGVYGDPEQTGKPAGDDLIEGKRTVLVALALQHADANDRAFIATRLGDPGLTPDDVERLRGILLGSGAVAGVEALIASLRAEAMAALGTIDGTSDGAEMMRRLAQALVDRSA